MDEDVGQKLLVEEYKSCRELIKTNIEIIERTEVYAAGAVGAIAVFSLSSSVEVVAKASAWIPLVIAALGIVRFYGVDSTIDKINTYLMTVEAAHPEIKWTTFYRGANTRKELKKSRYAIWIILLVLGIILGTLTLCKGPFGPPSAPSTKIATGLL